MADALNARLKEWREKEGWIGIFPPLQLTQEAIALGARADVALLVPFLRPPLHDLVLCGWADRDPEAAWDFYVAGVLERRLPNSAVQFLRRMAHDHWPMIENYLRHPGGMMENVASEAWAQRMMDAANPAEAWKLAIQAPEGRVRDSALAAAFRYQSARHPVETIALLAEVPESDRTHQAGQLAEVLARSHPALALKLVSGYPIHRTYNWIGDDYSSAEDTLEMTMRRDTAPSLKVLAQLLREGREMGHSGFLSKMTDSLPRRMEDWLPAAVEAAQGWSDGSEFLADLVAGCPWNDPADATKAVEAIADPGLQSAAASAWAFRWEQVEPDAAKAWAATLPPAAQAGALAALWDKATPPDAVLASCAQAGILPDSMALVQMSQEAPEATLPWLAAQPQADAWTIAESARAWADRDPAAAAAWAAQLPGEELRVRIVTAVMQPWLTHSPEAATAWLQASPLAEDDRLFVQDLTGVRAP